MLKVSDTSYSRDSNHFPPRRNLHNKNFGHYWAKFKLLATLALGGDRSTYEKAKKKVGTEAHTKKQKNMWGQKHIQTNLKIGGSVLASGAQPPESLTHTA